VYAQLVADAIDTYPTLGDELRKDLSRLHRAVKTRGIRAYCVDLPAVGKHLDRCLDEGRFFAPSPGRPFTRRANPQTVLPRFLGALYGKVFEACGRLKEDYDVEAIVFLRQILYLAKRTKLHHAERMEFAEKENFVASDLALPVPDRIWEAVGPSREEIGLVYRGFTFEVRYREQLENALTGILPGHSAGEIEMECLSILRTLDTVSGILTTELGRYVPAEWPCKHGPGAIAQVKGPANKYHWFAWDNRLDYVYPLCDHGYHDHATWAQAATSDWDVELPSSFSRLVAVPKTFTKPRLIAIEPSERQWCQQSLRRYFYDRFDRGLISKFVRIRDQTYNQTLCQKGSRDGTLATVDLSAASDSLSCLAVGNLFKQNPTVLQALMATRTNLCDLGDIVIMEDFYDGAWLMPLRKFATMGNACTFPVETLMFLAVAIAACLTARRWRVTTESILALTGEVAVYGDDIIVPVDSREFLCAILEALDFQVNSTKSFWTGRFRESCGTDYFDGHLVTPVYYSQPLDRDCPESIASVVDMRNHFYSKWFMHTAQYLASTIPNSTKVPTVHIDSGVSGLTSRIRPTGHEQIVRYSKDYHRCEVLAGGLLAHQSKDCHTDEAGVFQYFTEQPDPHTMWQSGVPQRPTTRWVRRWISLHDIWSDWAGSR
jgi:hypothetical protein